MIFVTFLPSKAADIAAFRIQLVAIPGFVMPCRGKASIPERDLVCDLGTVRIGCGSSGASVMVPLLNAIEGGTVFGYVLDIMLDMPVDLDIYHRSQASKVKSMTLKASGSHEEKFQATTSFCMRLEDPMHKPQSYHNRRKTTLFN